MCERQCCPLAGSSIVWKRRQCGGTILAARRAQYDDEEDWDEGPVRGSGALGASWRMSKQLRRADVRQN